MKVLLVDLSNYPIAYFPQLQKNIEIEEEKVLPGEFEKIYNPCDSYSYFSFSEEKLFGFDCLTDLLTAFCRKIGYDYFEIV